MRPLRLDWRESEVNRVVFLRVSEFAGLGSLDLIVLQSRLKAAGTNVERVRNWRRATSYAEKYLAREEEFPEGVQTGRVWGPWSKQLLPVRWERVEVSPRDAFRIRRTYRKLARRGGSDSLRRITVFVRYGNVLRWLEFLGYRLE